jgi:hypothetical protein
VFPSSRGCNRLSSSWPSHGARLIPGLVPVHRKRETNNREARVRKTFRNNSPSGAPKMLSYFFQHLLHSSAQKVLARNIFPVVRQYQNPPSITAAFLKLASSSSIQCWNWSVTGDAPDLVASGTTFSESLPVPLPQVATEGASWSLCTGYFSPELSKTA